MRKLHQLFYMGVFQDLENTGSHRDFLILRLRKKKEHKIQHILSIGLVKDTQRKKQKDMFE